MKTFFSSLYRSTKIIINLLVKGGISPGVKKIKIIKDDSCYIFGNGPSLFESISDKIDFFSDKTIFVVNNFALSDLYEKLKPEFYILLHDSYWNNEFTSSEMVIKAKAAIDGIIHKTTWDIKILVPLRASKKMINILKKNEKIKVCSFSDHAFEGHEKLRYFMYSNFFAVPLLQNVVIATIFFSVNWGFKEINLLGADHSWTEEIRVNSENEVCMLDRHFYDNSEEIKLQSLEKLYNRKYKMHELLIDFAKMFQGYHVLANYAKHKGVSIFNCTENSFIDAFERKKI